MFFLSTCSFFLGASLFSEISTVPYLNKKMAPVTLQEGVIVSIPPETLKDWKLAYHLVTRDGAIFEWIPKNESIENWSELFQIQSFSMNKQESAQNFAVNFFKTLKQTYPQIKTNVMHHSKDSVLLEWYLPQATADQAPQSELAKIIATDKGVYRIAYTKKIPSLTSKERQMWIDRLETARVIPREMPPAMFQPPTNK